MSLHVLIAGGGIGGLCLAQGLRKAGVSVAVYERDVSLDARPQGYRININAGGSGALAECLPADLYELYLATSNREGAPRVAAFDHRLRELFSRDVGGAAYDPMRAYTAVNRLTLRQILLAGLGDAVRFGHELVGFEHGDSGVRAYCADGSAAAGDVLVAADGVNSVVRRRLLPHAQVTDLGVRCVWGRTPLDARLLERVPEMVFNRASSFIDPRGRVLVIGAYRPRRPPTQAAAELVPDVRLDPVSDYLMWVAMGQPAAFPVPEAELCRSDPATLHRVALEMIGDWHPDLRRLVEHAEAAACFPQSIRVSRPVPPWPTTRVTLLGDAVHAMSPAGGTGAHTALRDAALLARQLALVERGAMGLRAAIAEYEAELRDYGFAAVERSLRYGETFARGLTSTREGALS